MGMHESFNFETERLTELADIDDGRLAVLVVSVCSVDND